MKKAISIAAILIGFAGGAAFSQTAQDGARLYHQERYGSAMQALATAVRNDPNDINAWYWLVRACQENHAPAEAVRYFNSIPPGLNGQPLYHVTRGRIELQNNDTVAARADFVEALGTGRKKDPSIQIAIAEANIDLDKGNLYFALEQLANAEKRDGKDPELFIARGDAARRLYDGSEAFRNFQRASELDPKDPVPYYKIGKIYQTQNNKDVFTSYYDKAIQADPSFGPVYYQLYYYYYFRDVNKAGDYLAKFIANTDPSPENDYLQTDLYYVSGKYNDAIQGATRLQQRDGANAAPRLYKLLAYSYDGINNNTLAEQNMKKYFDVAGDTSFTAEDFELMGKLSGLDKRDDEADLWYEKAFLVQKDTAKKAALARKMITASKAAKRYDKQYHWFDELYKLKAPMTNVDIFNWGLAGFNARNYVLADSIFGMYVTKYPDQTYGYYWRARSNAAIDTAMETGIAVPHYENLIRVAEKDTANASNRKWLIQAYGYIAAYKVNKEKLYNDALAYYDKILQLDPVNADAEKYKDILEKRIESETKAADKQ